MLEWNHSGEPPKCLLAPNEVAIPARRVARVCKSSGSDRHLESQSFENIADGIEQDLVGVCEGDLSQRLLQRGVEGDTSFSVNESGNVGRLLLRREDYLHGYAYHQCEQMQEVSYAKH
jgi:hypothetical protein